MRKRSRSSSKKSYKKSYKKTKRASKSLKKIVNRAISLRAENKHHQSTSVVRAIDGNIDNNDVLSLIPGIVQGTTDSTRVGNRITVKRLTMKMIINVFNNGASTPPTYFDIYIFKQKLRNFYAGAPTGADMLAFLQSNSSSVNYQGNILDGVRPVNEDLFTLCIKKRIMLFNPFSGGSTVAIGTPVAPSRTIKFDLTKHIKKTLIFDDNTGSCTNANLWIAVGSTQSDGSYIFVSVGQYQYILDISYEDS